jgi:hypothetical protein
MAAAASSKWLTGEFARVMAARMVRQLGPTFEALSAGDDELRGGESAGLGQFLAREIF